jgi:acetylglutamate kinase
LNASTKNSQLMNASTINCSTINSSFCNAFSMDTSIITSKIFQLEDASGGGGSDGVISESSNVLTIRTGASGGVTKFGTTTGGNFSVQIANDALNASTINSSQINATDIDCTTIDADTITGDIAGNLAAGSGISLSTAAGVTTISNTGSVTDPLNLSKLNVSNVSGDNLSMTRASISSTIESAISKATIFEVVDSSGLGGQPNGFIYEGSNEMTIRTGDVGGVIRFGTTYAGNFSVNIANDELNASKINASNMSVQSITSNNIYTPSLKAQYQNISFLYYDDVQGLSNPGIIYKAADKFQFWSGTGTTKLVFTNDNTNLSVEVANNELNASVANVSTGTIKTLTSTTGTIGQCNIGLINSSNINADILNGNIANNLAAGTNITLSTAGGVTTINSTGGGGGVTDPLNLSTLNASNGNIAIFNSSMATSDFINGTTANISTLNTSTSNSQLVNASVVNGDFLNGNIANNLLGGTNITLSTSSGVTTIDGPIRSVFGVMRIGVFSPGAVTDVRIPYNSTKITNSNYSWSGLVLTIATAGTYLISATCGLISSTYNNRVVGRIRTLTNGTWQGSADAESFCYLRHDDYGEFESMAICQFPRIFAAGDTLQIQCQVGKASAGGPGNSDFSGLVLAPGSNLTVEKVA